MSWSHPIWVLMEPVFQMRWSMPCCLKKEYSSAVAPVMAKLAPLLKSAPCAFDAGGSGSPKYYRGSRRRGGRWSSGRWGGRRRSSRRGRGRW
ncbi:Os06g0532101 [Oryza sativa Japonica Group]|uniref:Os06g0532101 protein n=1 Tax=Oryza sativa subsp. japonica TaxID=39947 RepID=A0A0P0WX97_ORYSJ|nr:hypothetical protein EE612_034639 [Oryza sativa]BAS98071.1 Os06g0532101 [Oryza sativa Japonica Group]